jgi:carnosine N-methyltransferase
MNLGISLIFQHTRVANQYEAAPYLHSFSHHRSSEKMLRTVSFPDVVPDRDATLTFTPGDFLELYRAQATHDAVVTLFFIDTVLSNFSLFPASAWD